MKIAQVITLFLPDFVGGATLVCARLARALVARGHRVEVFCGRPHGDVAPYSERTWEVDGVPVTGVHCAAGYVQLDPRNYRHPEVTRVFERFLDRARPEVVHFHSIQALGADLLEATAARGIPIVLTMHDWWWFCARLFLVDPADFVCPSRVASERCHCAPGFDFVSRRRFLHDALAHADRVLTPSRFLAEAAVANGVDAERVEVCPNGIDLSPWQGRRRPGPVRFGYVGGPDHRLKGLPTLIAAAAALDVGGWELVLHACAPARRHAAAGARLSAAAWLPLARHLTDRVGTTITIPVTILDRVRPAPAFAPDTLAQVLAALDCLVVPSLMRESYSLVTREALAAGVPVITSDSGGPAEVIRSGVNGLVFATGDADDLAAQMRRVVMEPELRERLRAGAAATMIPRIAAQVAQLERVYGALVHRRAPRTTLVATAPVTGTPRTARGPRSDAMSGLPRRVLFIAGIDGAPLRYRVTNLQDQLRSAGIASRVLYFTEPTIPTALADADLVVVYRVPMGAYVRAWLAEARRLGRPLVFSCDDLVFDAEVTPHAALALLPEDHRNGWHAYTARYAETLRSCDAFIGTTEPLVAAASRLGIPGFVIPNGLGMEQLAVGEAVRKQTWPPVAMRTRTSRRSRGADAAALRVAYVSGTLMHDLDFAVAEGALAEVLRTLPHVALRLVGYLHTGPALAPFADRIERLPFLPWQRLVGCLADVDVNLAPLAWPDAFSDAKSAIKYLEAAVLGVPTVATPTSAFRAAIRDGENGLLAATAVEWRHTLLRVLGDAGLRRRLGNAARDDAFLHYTPAAQVESTLTVMRTVCGMTRRGIAVRVTGEPGGARAASETPLARDAVTLAARYPGEVGRYDLEPEDAVPGAAQLSRDTPSPFLLPSRAVGQTFVANGNGLYRVDLCVGTDGRRNAHRLIVHLTDRPGGRDLRRVAFDTAAVAEDAWVAVEFEPITDGAGRSFYCWVEAEGATEGNAVTLWTYVHGWGEKVPSGLHINHRPAPGSLAFRTFRRRPEDASIWGVADAR